MAPPPFLIATLSILSLNLWILRAFGYDNGLAITPQMGWNTWNHFGCSISETLILSAAQALVDSGLQDAGYEYILIDDCWQAAARDNTTGAPVADSSKFPNGIKHLSDSIHALGLKIGIYSSAGIHTCAGFFGSLGYEQIDAQTYASWEIDYLKYDNCYNQGRSGTPLISFERYQNMSLALAATGRPILYSMCQWGEDGPWNWATEIANSWRISGDIQDVFDVYDDRCPCTSMLDCKLPGFHCSVTRIIDFAAPLTQKSGRGKWNDLDMLEIGNGGMTFDEYVTHFSMWAIIKSPMILGNDITNMTADTLSIITNPAVLSITLDPNAAPAHRIWKKTAVAGDIWQKSPVPGDIQLWMTTMSNSTTVVALMNTTPHTQTVTVSFTDVFRDYGAASANAAWQVYDLWGKTNGVYTLTGQDKGAYRKSLPNVSIKSHQTKMWKLQPPLVTRRDNLLVQKCTDEL